ncbi:hypothetical protein BGZ58_010567, partial [Dissophora ornata]
MTNTNNDFKRDANTLDERVAQADRVEQDNVKAAKVSAAGEVSGDVDDVDAVKMCKFCMTRTQKLCKRCQCCLKECCLDG